MCGWEKWLFQVLGSAPHPPVSWHYLWWWGQGLKYNFNAAFSFHKLFFAQICLLLRTDYRSLWPTYISIFKSRDITLPTKVHLVKALVFPVVMYGCESWTVKKAKRRRIDGFELWWSRRLLRVPWTARRSSQSILKEINPGITLEGVMLKLFQYFGHLIRRVNSLEKTLMLGGIGDWRKGDDGGWYGWMASPTQWTRVWVNCGRWWWTGRPGVLQLMGSQRVRHDWMTELNWTDSWITSL